MRRSCPIPPRSPPCSRPLPARLPAPSAASFHPHDSTKTHKEFLPGVFDYWEDRSEKNAQVLLDWLLTIEGTTWHYLHGVSDPSKISPANWVIDQAYQDRPGNKDVKLSILYNAKRDLNVFRD